MYLKFAAKYRNVFDIFSFTANKSFSNLYVVDVLSMTHIPIISAQSQTNITACHRLFVLLIRNIHTLICSFTIHIWLTAVSASTSKKKKENKNNQKTNEQNKKRFKRKMKNNVSELTKQIEMESGIFITNLEKLVQTVSNTAKPNQIEAILLFSLNICFRASF